jgi:hypothetical protein
MQAIPNYKRVFEAETKLKVVLKSVKNTFVGIYLLQGSDLFRYLTPNGFPFSLFFSRQPRCFGRVQTPARYI